MSDVKLMAQNRVINGTFGKLVLDGEIVSSVKAAQAKIDIETEEVYIPDNLMAQNAVTKATGKGSVTIYKIDSMMHKKVGQALRRGETPYFTIISSLRDPKAYGAETIVVNEVLFTDLTLFDWERAKNGEMECPFVFGSMDYEDLI